MAENDRFRGEGSYRRGAPNRYPRSRPPRRFYQNHGIRDLREVLDRKRQERANEPEPSYNNPKDPLRGNECPDNRRRQENNEKIKNPVNIKVEFSIETDKHTYTIDESTTLPPIKHIPDKHTPKFYNRGRSRGFRSRGRTRGYQSRIISRNRYNDWPPSSASTEIETSQVPNIDKLYEGEEMWDDLDEDSKNEKTLDGTRETDIGKEETREEINVKIDEKKGKCVAFKLNEGEEKGLAQELSDLKLEN